MNSNKALVVIVSILAVICYMMTSALFVLSAFLAVPTAHNPEKFHTALIIMCVGHVISISWIIAATYVFGRTQRE